MENIDFVVLISRWLHIMAVVLAIGGAAYALFAVGPAAKDVLDADARAKLREGIRARWSWFVHGSIVVLLITGFTNFYCLALAPRVPPMPYHAFFGPKLLLAFVIFFIATALVGRAPGLEKMREASSKWLGVLLFLAAVIILISGLLAQFRSA